jgi:hypothetical protein
MLTTDILGSSAFGNKRTFAFIAGESAFRPKADMGVTAKREGKGLQRVCDSPCPNISRA